MNLNKRIELILKEKKTTVLELKNEYSENFIFIFRSEKIEVFNDATYRNNSVSGFRISFIDKNTKSVFKFLKSKTFYPYEYEYLKVE